MKQVHQVMTDLHSSSQIKTSNNEILALAATSQDDCTRPLAVNKTGTSIVLHRTLQDTYINN